MSFRATNCLDCRRDIQIPTDVAAPNCPYCGAVIQQETAAPAATMSALLGLARTAMTAGNSKEALDYFNRVLESDPTHSEAWIGKGKAAGWQSTIANIRLPEMLIAFNNAIATASDAEKAATVSVVVEEANRLVVTLYGMTRKHLLEFVSVDKTWPDHVQHVALLVTSLEEVAKWDPQDRNTLENIVHLCKENIEGVSFRDQFRNNAARVRSLAPQYEVTIRTIMESASDRLRAIDPSYSPPAINKATADACFVVTATMGDFDHPDVTFMRRFRDDWILPKPWGPAAVRAYYRVGPYAAAAIEGSVTRRRLSYWLLVRPSAWAARWFLRLQ